MPALFEHTPACAPTNMPPDLQLLDLLFILTAAFGAGLIDSMVGGGCSNTGVLQRTPAHMHNYSALPNWLVGGTLSAWRFARTVQIRGRKLPRAGGLRCPMRRRDTLQLPSPFRHAVAHMPRRIHFVGSRPRLRSRMRRLAPSGTRGPLWRRRYGLYEDFWRYGNILVFFLCACSLWTFTGIGQRQGGQRSRQRIGIAGL